jgi:hypothetical protein
MLLKFGDGLRQAQSGESQVPDGKDSSFENSFARMVSRTGWTSRPHISRDVLVSGAPRFM